jgi:hypothetical protein
MGRKRGREDQRTRGPGRGSARRVLGSWFIVFAAVSRVGVALRARRWVRRESARVSCIGGERTAGDSRPYQRRRSREGEAVGSIIKAAAGQGWPALPETGLGQHVVLSLPSRQADASPTRPYLGAQTGSDPVALAPRVNFQFFEAVSGDAEDAFTDLETAELGRELTAGGRERLAEMIKRHRAIGGSGLGDIRGE